MATYKVIKGDTMWDIAKKNGIGLNELLTANPDIKNPSLIIPGQTINIPSIDSLNYTVLLGDTLWSIAKKQGIELNKLLAANPDIKNPELIYPGQVINIPSSTTTPSVSDDIRRLEKEVIDLVNNERKKVGLSPLTENSELSRIARIKSKDFINNNYFGHNSPTYGSPFDMLKSFGIKFTSAAENIASGQSSPEKVMNTWMNSSGHRSNILNSTYNQIGVGVARSDNGNLFWTQLFIRS